MPVLRKGESTRPAPLSSDLDHNWPFVRFFLSLFSRCTWNVLVLVFGHARVARKPLLAVPTFIRKFPSSPAHRSALTLLERPSCQKSGQGHRRSLLRLIGTNSQLTPNCFLFVSFSERPLLKPSDQPSDVWEKWRNRRFFSEKSQLFPKQNLQNKSTKKTFTKTSRARCLFRRFLRSDRTDSTERAGSYNSGFWS